MEKIIIPKPRNDSLLAQLESLYKTFVNIGPRENLNFDLTLLDWVCPLLILPISAYINNTRSRCEITNSSIKTYLERIGFPKGVGSISLFQQKIQRHKSFIPISVLKKEAGASRERLESLFSEKIHQILGSVSGAQNAVCYPISRTGN